MHSLLNCLVQPLNMAFTMAQVSPNLEESSAVVSLTQSSLKKPAGGLSHCGQCVREEEEEHQEAAW